MSRKDDEGEIISARKLDHIRLCLDEDVETGDPGFSRYRLIPESFPELSWDEVDTSAEFLGRKLSFPFMIGSMSGGTGTGAWLNRTLAEAAQEAGVALALGSMRPLLENRKLIDDYGVTGIASGVPVFGNISAWEIRDQEVRDRLWELADDLGLAGMVVHVNPAQELVQTHGERDFRNALLALEEFTSMFQPVIVKEVGTGLSTIHLEGLRDMGVAAVDVSGRGGTDFTRVEALRRHDEPSRRIGMELAGFGVPTAHALLSTRAALDDLDDISDCPGPLLIASGGIRTAHDVALCLAMGANVASAALPFLKAAMQGKESVLTLLNYLREGLRTYLLLTGSRTCADILGRYRCRTV